MTKQVGVLPTGSSRYPGEAEAAFGATVDFCSTPQALLPCCGTPCGFMIHPTSQHPIQPSPGSRQLLVWKANTGASCS